MTFKPSYFEEEVRDGYYVSGMMKRYWAAQMEILLDLAQVCEKLDIRWFADFGTLLGATRHEGFIPWDDDLDICMLRDDYDRFLAEAPGLLPSNYKIFNFKTSEYYENTTRVVNTDGMVFNQEFTSKYHEIPFSVGIDIFFMDYISRDKEQESARQQLYSVVSSSAVSCDFSLPLSSDVEEILALIENVCSVKIDRGANIKKQLFYIAESLATMFTEKDADQVAVLNKLVEFGSHIYPKDYFKYPLKLKFENIYVNVPRYYTGKLKKDYGNYITPTRSGGLHGYPLYENNEQATYKYLGAEGFFNFKPNKDNITNPLTASSDKADKVLILIRKLEDYSYVKKFACDYSTNGQVYIMAMPYYYRDFTGRFLEPNIENLDTRAEEICLNQNIHIANFTDYDIAAEHPDIIITTNGYDGFNQVYSVNPALYTDKLKACTDKLIYVQPFETEPLASPDDKTLRMMDYYVNIPAVENSHALVIWSDENKEAYINYLVNKYGEEKRDLLERKILVCQLDEKPSVICEEKKLFYYLNLAECNYHGAKAIEKLKHNISIFSDNASLKPVLYIDTNLRNQIYKFDSDILTQIENIARENRIEIVNEDELAADKLASQAAAYYGDMGPYIRYFIRAGKPVMIANIELT